MNCEGLIERLGFECRSVRKNLIVVGTPFTFSDGEPINFYLQESGDAVSISDNADTLAHLAGVGIDIADKRTWRGVKQACESFGLDLHDSGEISGKTLKDRQTVLITSYISAMLSIVEHEREWLGLSEEQTQYVNEVEMYLRASKPEAPLVLAPTVKGHSGRPHTFHFEFDSKLVEATRPHGGRTGVILRKSLDVINALTKKEILVVMDDREDPERAKIETDILSTSVSVLQFTTLVNRAGGNRIPS